MPRPNQAINNPVNAPKKEIHTGDMHIEQRDTISMSLDPEDSPLLRSGDSISLAEPGGINMAYVNEIAFNEEPIEVRIERSNEKNAPRWVPCWVNGRGAEVFRDGKWHILGALPLGIPCITRRKYIEVLALAKQDSVDTKPPTPSDILEGKNDVNDVEISTTAKYPFSVLKDNNPRGAEWLNKLMYLRA
jgi:hypothetical protein